MHEKSALKDVFRNFKSILHFAYKLYTSSHSLRLPNLIPTFNALPASPSPSTATLMSTEPSDDLPYVFQTGSQDPSSPTIIWLHGGLESHHEFTLVLTHLPPNIYHLLLLDLPGFGVQLSNDFSILLAMTQLEDSIRRYAHRKCYIVGFSLG